MRGFCLAAIFALASPGVRAAVALNPGLGEPPESVDRETPAAAVQGFLRAAHAGHYLLAAHYLWLNHLPNEHQPTDARARAMAVAGVDPCGDWHCIRSGSPSRALRTAISRKLR